MKNLLLIAVVLAASLVLSSGVQADPIQWAANGNSYEAIGFLSSWEEANAKAQSLNFNGVFGHLATLTSAEENAFVMNTFKAERYWLGGFQTDDLDEPAGNWVWVTGEVWAYTNWASAEPNNQGGNEQHLQFNGSQWNDNSALLGSVGKEPGFIVEYESNSVPEAEPLEYIDVISLSDIDGNGVPETAALSGRRATIHDSATGLWLRNVNFFWRAWSVKAIATLDSDFDGMPELAALGHHNENGRILVEVKDVTSGDRIGRIRFFAYQDMIPVSLTIGDVDFNGAPDIGVMAVRADGRVAVEYRDAATGEKLPDWIRDKIWFPPY